MPGPYLNAGIFQTSLASVDSVAKEELGVWRYDSGKIARYVRAGALIPKGESVRMDLSASGVTGVLLGNQVVQTSGATDMFMGVAETTVPLFNYSWVTIYGMATARVNSGEVPGTPLGPSVNTGVLSVRNSSHFNAVGLAVQSGLSAGSAVFISHL